MKSIRALALPLLLALGAGSAHAWQEPFAVDVTGIGLIPSSTYKQSVGPGLGALAGFELEASPSIALTGRGGYISHMQRGDYGRSLVPILGGLKFTSYGTSLYIAGEAGRVRVRDRYEGDDTTVSDRRAIKTAWGLGVGSAVDRLDLRVSMHVWDAAKASDNVTIDVSLAFMLFGSY
jgi:hypothetical protein